MRKRLFAVLLMPLCLLAACGKQGNEPMQAALALRTQLLRAEECAMTAQLRVDVEDRIYDVTLACVFLADGSAELTVTAPETICGICARLDGDGGMLEFDGIALELGRPADCALAPIELPALLLRCWQAAYIDSAGTEEGEIHVCYDADTLCRDAVIDTWLNEENIPIRAEIRLDGRRIALVTLSDVQINGGTQ